MARYREALPQLSGELFLTDGGIETTLIFHEGQTLPDFAAFHLLKDLPGEAVLLSYFRRYAQLARRLGTGLVLESATWRASSDWGRRLGYDADALARANRHAMRLLELVRHEAETDNTRIVASGCIGPRGDGYVPANAMSADQAHAYHAPQIDTFAATAADMVCAMTMNYVAEAQGVVEAARQARMPVAISFTVETDGRLPTGQGLGEAVAQVDEATGGYPLYYMVNCAHPTHFEHVLTPGQSWLTRMRGLRANASCMSHAQLNDAPELDAGDPVQLGRQFAALRGRWHCLNVMGGCCGTDHRHIEEIAIACLPLFAAPRQPSRGVAD